jgi:cell division protein FtsN
MSHDFAKKPKAKPKGQAKAQTSRNQPAPKTQVPGWVWLFTGIVTGVFIGFLVFLADMPSERKATKPAMVQAPSKPEPEPDNSATNSTRFDFYTLLPEREVIVPEEQSQPATDNKPEVIYYLQAGSFKSAEDADRLRARLILMGMDAKVEAVSGKGSGTWHRVQVGPFSSRSKLSKARNQLISEGIETLLLRRKA